MAFSAAEAAKNGVLLMVTTIICLSILEIALRFLTPSTPFTSLIPLRPHQKKQLHVDLRGVAKVVEHSTNKWGLRGDPPPADWEDSLTILAIGGSTTQCYYLDDKKTWPYLLQSKLENGYPGIWVGNGGLDGQSTRSHIVFMEEIVARLLPDVALFLVGINDLAFSISEDQRLFEGLSGRSGWKYRIYEASRLVQIAHTWSMVLFSKATIVRDTGHGTLQPKALGEDRARLPENLDEMLPGLAEYEENILRIIQLGKKLGVRTIFMTQPMLFDDSPRWREVEGSFYWIDKLNARLSAADTWRLLDRYNKTLIKVCRKEQVPVLDLASIIEHDEANFYDSVHMTEEGAEKVAKELATFIPRYIQP